MQQKSSIQKFYRQSLFYTIIDLLASIVLLFKSDVSETRLSVRTQTSAHSARPDPYR
jgi:hypothetical protein